MSKKQRTFQYTEEAINAIEKHSKKTEGVLQKSADELIKAGFQTLYKRPRKK